MGLSYRKRKKIAPGISLNLSTKGVGLSAGPKGAKVSKSTSRKKTGVSLGKSGFRWSKRI